MDAVTFGRLYTGGSEVEDEELASDARRCSRPLAAASGTGVVSDLSDSLSSTSGSAVDILLY